MSNSEIGWASTRGDGSPKLAGGAVGRRALLGCGGGGDGAGDPTSITAAACTGLAGKTLAHGDG